MDLAGLTLLTLTGGTERRLVLIKGIVNRRERWAPVLPVRMPESLAQ